MFLSIEVRSHVYQFPPLRPRQLPTKLDIEACLDSSYSEKSEYRQPAFRYHPLHDLEALWWVAVYFLICKDFDGPEDEDDTSYRTVACQSPIRRRRKELRHRHRVRAENRYGFECMYERTYRWCVEEIRSRLIQPLGPSRSPNVVRSVFGWVR